MEKENNEIKQPIYSLIALNYGRYFSIFLLILIGVTCFILTKHIGFILAFLGIYCISMIFFIKFPRIDLYKGYFVIIRKSIINKLSDQKRYNYNDLKDIKFSKGFNNWSMIMISFLFSFMGSFFKSYNQHSKRDSMILTLTNNKTDEINKIGNRDNFIKLIEEIKKKMPSH